MAPLQSVHLFGPTCASLAPQIAAAASNVLAVANNLSIAMGTSYSAELTVSIRSELLEVAHESGVQINMPIGVLMLHGDALLTPYMPRVYQHFEAKYGYSAPLVDQLFDNVLKGRTLRKLYFMPDAGNARAAAAERIDAIARMLTDSQPAGPITPHVPHIEPAPILGEYKPRATQEIHFHLKGSGFNRGGFKLDPYDNWNIFVELIGGNATGLLYCNQTVLGGTWKPLENRHQYTVMWLEIEERENQIYLRKEVAKVYADVTIEQVRFDALNAMEDAWEEKKIKME